jgi:adenylate cyclase
MSRDEEGTHAQIKALQRDVIGPIVQRHQGRMVKTTGDGFLIEFASPVEAVRCALPAQKELEGGPLQLRIGINLGDVIIEPDGDVYGEGVNVAARLQALCDPGGVLISGKVFDEADGKIEATFESRGEQQVKNIAKPVRVYALSVPGTVLTTQSKPLPLPDRPSIAVVPFTNMSGDPEQEYFADGIVEDIITALSRVRWFFVIARNSSFTYKGKPVDIRQVGRELGVRYVLEGSIRKLGSRVRIRVSSSRPRQATTSGLISLMATSQTFSSSKTKSPRRWSVPSSRVFRRRRLPGPRTSRPTTSMPMTSTYAPLHSFGR